MNLSRTEQDVFPDLKQIQGDWPLFFLERIDHFKTLAGHLLDDEALVESAILRAVASLENTPLDVSDAALAYKQARCALIQEVLAVLNSQQHRVSSHPVCRDR